MKPKMLITLLSMTACSLCAPFVSASETKSNASSPAKTVEQKRATGTNFNEATTRRTGGSDPGGGGGVRKDGVLKTLSETGFIFERAFKSSPIKEYSDYYEIKAETKAEIRTVLSAIYLKRADIEDYSALILGERDTFISQSNIGAIEYVQIKKDYDIVVRSFGQKLDSSSFVLVAYSREKKTYILPSFADFTPRRQALTLIHEYNMRQGLEKLVLRNSEIENWTYRSPYGLYGSKDKKETVANVLSDALQFDSALHKFLQSPGDDRSIIDFQSVLFSLRYTGLFRDSSQYSEANYREFGRLFGTLEAAMRRPPLASELFLRPVGLKSYDRTTFDPSLVKRFENLVPMLANRLDGLALEPGGFWRLYYDDGTSKFRREHDSHWGRGETSEVQQKRLRMFDEQCFAFGEILGASKIPGDAFLHYDERTQTIYMINCGPSVDEPAKTKGYGAPMILK